MIQAFIVGVFFTIGVSVVSLLSCVAWVAKRFDDDLL